MNIKIFLKNTHHNEDFHYENNYVKEIITKNLNKVLKIFPKLTMNSICDVKVEFDKKSFYNIKIVLKNNHLKLHHTVIVQEYDKSFIKCVSIATKKLSHQISRIKDKIV